MSGDVHVQFLERLRVKLPWSTQPYIKVKGQWVYLYRAVDKEGNTIDFMLSEKQDESAARAFFEKKVIGSNGVPEKVTMDKIEANKAGIDKPCSLSLAHPGIKLLSDKLNTSTTLFNRTTSLSKKSLKRRWVLRACIQHKLPYQGLSYTIC